MNLREHTEIKSEKSSEIFKARPFFVLFLLAFLGFAFFYVWQWQNEMASQSLRSINRSNDMDILLSNEVLASSDTDTLDTLKQYAHSELAKEVIALEKQVTQFLPKAQEEVLHDDITKENNQSTSDENDENSVITSPPQQSTIVDLALRNVFVFQGENGNEEWRIKTEWATLRQESGILSMYKPILLYAVGEKKSTEKKESPSRDEVVDLSQFLNVNSTQKTQNQSLSQNVIHGNEFFNNTENSLIVTSDTGIIYDTLKVYLNNNVHAKQKDHRIMGELMTYDNATRQIHLLNHGKFASNNIVGHGDSIKWDLNTNIISSSGNVEFIWTPEKS